MRSTHELVHLIAARPQCCSSHSYSMSGLIQRSTVSFTSVLGWLLVCIQVCSSFFSREVSRIRGCWKNFEVFWRGVLGISPKNFFRAYFTVIHLFPANFAKIFGSASLLGQQKKMISQLRGNWVILKSEIQNKGVHL